MRLRDELAPAAAMEEVTRLLSKRHSAEDFVIFSSDADRKTAEGFVATGAFVFAAIGAVSLVVGGVGVMNIMLLSASERAHEIGIRIAVGARRSDIRNQFLIEAIMACLLGAAGGVSVSVAIGALLTQLTLVAVGSAILTGVVAGYAPARKAARLDLVEALARD